LNKISIIFISLLVLILAVCISFFHIIPKYEDTKRNSTYSNSPITDKKIIDFHNSLFIADLHADSLLWNRNLSSKHSYGHIDIPRMQNGNMGLQVFSVVTKTPRGLNYYANDDTTDNITFLALAQRWPKVTWESLLHRAIYQSQKLHKLAGNEQLTIIRTKRDINHLISARNSNQALIGGLLSLEGAHALEGNLDNVDSLFNHGFRIIGFTHFFDNKLGGSAHGINKGGLTKFGLSVLKRMEKLGLLVDISHASSALINDIFDHATKPVIATHTGVKGVCGNSPRNLTDLQVSKIAKSGGVIGIGFWQSATCTNNISGIIKSIKYVIDLVGINYIALGSDFDGSVQMPFDVSNIGLITEELVIAGYSKQEIRKIMGLNIINLLKNTLPN
jgi:microsomal dipeptidase-like Zn-dependent dipeptidase